MLSALLGSINLNIVVVALPTIFRGLNIDPFSSGEFLYLLWMLMGYTLIIAITLLTLGRISDVFGRVKIYIIGFILFTVASVFLALIPNGSANNGAILLISLRMIQGLGASCLAVNSVALITLVFPAHERGRALGINQIAFSSGTILGLIFGGFLAKYDWHLIFLISVPFGIAGTIWSTLKLKEVTRKQEMKVDYLGNVSYGLAIILLSLGFTYTLTPYGNTQTGWENPLVLLLLVSGIISFMVFVLVERIVSNPMFNLSLFKIKSFAYGNISLLLSGLARGSLLLLVVILLQGVYLPLHGYPYSQVPFWAGIYLLPMAVGMIVFSPIGGVLADRYGVRNFATFGMVLTGIGLYLLTFLSYDFDLVKFEVIMFLVGVGSGLFSSPNTISIISSISFSELSSANAVRTTVNYITSTISMAIFFSVAIVVFSLNFPGHAYASTISLGFQVSVARAISQISPSSILFGSFLGTNPISVIPSGILSSLSLTELKTVESTSFLSSIVGTSYMVGFRISLLIAATISGISSLFSYLLDD